MALAALFLLLGYDSRLHWDEPGFLYTGGYLTLAEILEDGFEPTRIEGFNRSRILHLVVVRAVVETVGLGVPALATLMLFYLLLLLLFSYFLLKILRLLLPDPRGTLPAVIALSFTPVYLYLAFKTLPEIPALLLSAIASYAFLESLRRRPLPWLLLAILSLAAVGLVRNLMALFFLALVFALLLFPGGFARRRAILTHIVLVGVGSLAIFLTALLGLGIELNAYFGTLVHISGKAEPFLYTLLGTLLEGGVLLLVIPLALIGKQERAPFFLTWLLGASLPVLLRLEHVEARYLAANVGAMAGLICLAVRSLSAPLATAWRRHRELTVAIGTGAVALLAVWNSIALSIMAHEVRTDQLARILGRLDRIEGSDTYAVLTPWSHTDFHYLRFVYPTRRVYSVYTRGTAEPELSPEEEHYREWSLDTLEELRAVELPLVYLGFRENHSVANLRSLARRLEWLDLERHFRKRAFLDHLAVSWMWSDPRLEFVELAREGHYIAYRVSVTESEDAAALLGAG